MPKTAILRQIEKVTGVTRGSRQTSGRGKSGRDVNAGRAGVGKRGGFGTTTQLREDLVAAFGGD